MPKKLAYLISEHDGTIHGIADTKSLQIAVVGGVHNVEWLSDLIRLTPAERELEVRRHLRLSVPYHKQVNAFVAGDFWANGGEGTVGLDCYFGKIDEAYHAKLIKKQDKAK